MADTTQTLEEKLAAIAQAMQTAETPAEAPKAFACPIDPQEAAQCQACQ